MQAGMCTQLQKVEVVAGRSVDDAGLTQLTNACPCLRQLVLKVRADNRMRLLSSVGP
jgi:hypothetical protein